MPTNDFLVFAGGGGANVLSQANYLALPALSNGFTTGTALSAQLNKVWRQSSIMASMIGQFIADNSGNNATDDGTTATLETNFKLAIQSVTRVKLLGAQTLYVNASSGSDSNTGTTPAAAFRTIQAAINAGYANYDYNRNNLIISVADGTYTGGVTITQQPLNCLQVQVTGDLGTPANCQLNVTNGFGFNVVYSAIVLIQGMQITASGTGAGQGYAVQAAYAGQATVQTCNIGSCGTTQLNAAQSGTLFINSGVTLSGTSGYGVAAQAASYVSLSGVTLNYSSATYTSANFNASFAGTVQATGALFTGTATGTRYTVSANGILMTNGGGANFFPGTVAGTTATGGQYI